MSVYTFRDLEKFLPSVASINKIQVKEYLDALTDESLIRCEKIGSGNWYWCFKSDAKKSKENEINSLKQEESKTMESIKEAETAIDAEMKIREEDEEMLDGGGLDRKALLEIHEGLVREAEELGRELALYSDNDPAEVVRKKKETKVLKEAANRWTDNIESMASYLTKMSDRDTVAGAMLQACGDEYVFGEGLKELVDP
jgi:hypothetical protein